MVENQFKKTFEVNLLKKRVKDLEYDCAELTKENVEFREKIKKLASRQPEWPKNYRPRRNFNRNSGRTQN